MPAVEKFTTAAGEQWSLWNVPHLYRLSACVFHSIGLKTVAGQFAQGWKSAVGGGQALVTLL